MISIAIHGTKGGFGLIYGEKKIFSDPNSDTTNWQAIGQSAYSLMFINNSRVYSKYKIIRDVIGDKRQGNITFSVIIPSNKKISGIVAISILEDISNEYQKFMDGNNLVNVYEDWAFISRIIEKYKSSLIEFDTENVQSGNIDPAYIYYEDILELQKYFDNPEQDEYKKYKQIYFIHKELKYNKDANPLNSLIHSNFDLTETIILDNPPYKLRDYNGQGMSGVIIEIKANDRIRNNNDKIFKNDNVSIKYSKNYYKKIYEKGRLSDANLSQYLKIDENNGKIDVIKNVQLEPESKELILNIERKKDYSKVYNAEIKIDNNPWQVRPSYIFSGEELGKEHSIQVKSGDYFFSKVQKIKPYDFKEEVINLPIQLIERRELKITAIEDNQTSISNFKVWVQGKIDSEVTDNIVFTDEEVNESWNITIEKDGYKRSESKRYLPKSDNNNLSFTLEKESLKEIEDRGLNSGLGFEKVKRKNKISSFFSKPVIFATTIVSLIFLIAGFFILKPMFHKDKPSQEIVNLNAEEINNYVEGDSLLMSELETYKVQWKNQENGFIKKKSKNILEKFFVGSGENDSTKWKSEWKPVNECLERAISKRTAIDSLNFNKLKDTTFKWSEDQQSFKDIIYGLDSSKYDLLKNNLGNVSSLTLTKIKDSIISILDGKDNIPDPTISEPENITNYLKESKKFKLEDIKVFYNTSGLSENLNKSLLLVKSFIEKGYKDCATFKRNANNDMFLKDNKNLATWVSVVCKDNIVVSNPNSSTNNQSTGNPTPNPSQNASTNNNNTTEIISYLKGGELKKATLEEYLKDTTLNKKLKPSIKLCLKFWSLNGETNNSYSSYIKELRNDSNFNNSKLRKLVEDMNSQSAPKYVVDLPSTDQNKSLTRIIEKINK